MADRNRRPIALPGVTPSLSLVVLLLTAVLAAVLLLAGCGASDTTATGPAATSEPTATTGPAATSTSAPGIQFTAAQLAEFDGKDGQPAYVAVDGVVYDVSDSARWPEGMHSSCNLGAAAGGDLSDLIRQAPANMRSLLERMPVVGSLVP